MKKIKIIILLSVFLGYSYAHSFADNREVNILVLLTYHQSFPWAESFIAGLNRSRERYDEKISFHIEIMETLNFKSSLSDAQWAAYISKKYKFTDFDAAIAESGRASLFLNKYSMLLASGIPRIYYTGTGVAGSSLNRVFSAQYNESVTKTVDMALKQNPNAENIYIIRGDERSNDRVIEIIKDLLKTRPDLIVHMIDNFTFEELTLSLEKIREKSIIFFTIILKDRNGQAVVSKEALAGLSVLSASPIYSFWSSLMGSGIVGGCMIDGAVTAERMVDAAMDYTNEGKFRDEYDTLRTFIDWNALKKYGIDEDSIPADAFLINKPVSILDFYFAEFMLVFAVFAFLLSILFLYWSRKLAGANKKLEDLNNEIMLAKEEAEELARIDPLSGLNNRLAFFEKWEQVCREIKRLGKPVSLLMLDIDHFKKINDTFGHIQGDRVIIRIAEIMNKCKREADISIRFGGEEFIVVAPFTDLRGAKNLAERIRLEAEKSIIQYGDIEIRFTVSIGVYSAVPSECDLNHGIKCADDALYKAKENGRNQVVLWEAA
ncbi:MAG: GGDEF domain-containing protein [Spirochaetes bacterium]|nr:GGDEF domain-containing protein [Spirochaetota bacterium]